MPPATQVSTTTAPVTRGDVVRRVTVAGTMGYDGQYQVVNQLPAGVLTALAAPGTVAQRGDRLFAVAGTAVVLCYGTVPAYREFASGMSDGADVQELEENLVALGADPQHAIRVDNHFTATTAAAIRRWQATIGVPAAERDSTLPLGRVVFLPGPLRVAEVATDAGGQAAGGQLAPGALVAPGTPVLSATSATQVVTAQVGTDQEYLVHVGDAVRVQLPAGEPVAGQVTRISRVATGSGDGPGNTPTVPVTIALPLPPTAGPLDQAPVQVQITVDQHRGVLMVPVGALLAAPDGYQVRVVAGATRQLVSVQPGLYDDAAGTVEVTGAGLAEGMTVEVPAS